MALNRREPSLLPCKTVVRRASCDVQRTADFRVTDTRAPLRWLCLGRWQNTLACHARAPCYAGCGHLTRHGRALHRRKASLLPCKTVVRRPSCDLQRTAGFRVTDARAPLRWLCLGRWQNTQACRERAPCCACCGRLLHYVRALHRREASLFGARPWCDVRAVTSNTQLAFAWHARKRHCAGCLSGGGETRELASRACRATLVMIVLRTIEWH